MLSFAKTPLPYDFTALEPYFDALTMEIHHTKHHQTYADKLNAALATHPELPETTLKGLVQNLDALPEDIKTAVRNHGGGLLNHNIFFTHLSATPKTEPTGELATGMNAKWGDYPKFKEAFNASAASVFGSGWTWLAQDPSSKELAIINTPNQDNPIMTGLVPVLGLDVWEHAYYLKYQNRRPEYIEAFWHVLDWEKVVPFKG